MVTGDPGPGFVLLVLCALADHDNVYSLPLNNIDNSGRSLDLNGFVRDRLLKQCVVCNYHYFFQRVFTEELIPENVYL